jgi:hypothetical protein
MDPQTGGVIETLIFCGAILAGLGLASATDPVFGQNGHAAGRGVFAAGAVMLVCGLLSLLIAHVRWS